MAVVETITFESIIEFGEWFGFGDTLEEAGNTWKAKILEAVKRIERNT